MQALMFYNTTSTGQIVVAVVECDQVVSKVKSQRANACLRLLHKDVAMALS